MTYKDCPIDFNDLFSKEHFHDDDKTELITRHMKLIDYIDALKPPFDIYPRSQSQRSEHNQKVRDANIHILLKKIKDLAILHDFNLLTK